MKEKLALNWTQVERCRALAREVAGDTLTRIDGLTTISVERSVVRLYGVDGVDALNIPLPNVFVDALKRVHGLEQGAAYWLAAGMCELETSAQQVAEAVAAEELDLMCLAKLDPVRIRGVMRQAAGEALENLRKKNEQRRFLRTSSGNYGPMLYVLTATGNVYEDVAHALAVAENGGHIVAVIRSTAQSLLDYVPFGPTTEGFGGTYATQENFRIMRTALDDWSEKNGRYVRLSSFCSGLCMPEIAVMGAIEGFDNMVNDALYGILYRDINMLRTLVDQRFSRRINSYFGVTINTGEDNYLRTDDAVDAAPSVVASQMINYELAKASGLPDEHIGIGNAFEIHPGVVDGLLMEIAQAQLTRELFPHCAVKYMPPTRHMNGNLFRTHANDTLFNMVSVLTDQAIQTLGVPTEGIFTPHIHDRVLGLECANYVHSFGRSLSEEIYFKPGGFIQKRAHNVLDKAEQMLESIAQTGLFSAIGEKAFGNVRRGFEEGRGRDGIVEIGAGYVNPFQELMEGVV